MTTAAKDARKPETGVQMLVVEHDAFAQQRAEALREQELAHRHLDDAQRRVHRADEAVAELTNKQDATLVAIKQIRERDGITDDRFSQLLLWMREQGMITGLGLSKDHRR